MAAQSLGTLVVNVAANTAQLQNDLGKAARLTEQRMDSLRKSATAAGTAIGASLAAGFGIIEESVRRSLDTFDEFSKASQKVGVTTEEFSKLAYAAKLSDVSTEDLTTTLGKLAKNQVEAAKGTAEQEQAFRSLGIAVKNADGSLRAPNEVLGDLADLFQSLPDGAGKTAIAIGLLGKSGANAIPLLNGGSAALKDMGDEAERLGVVIDTATGKAAEEFNDNLTRIGVAAQGLGAQLTANLLPDLLALEQRLIDTGSQADGVHAVADAVRAIGDSAKLAVNSVQALTNGVIGMFNAAKAASELTGPGFLKNLVTGQLGDKYDEARANLSAVKTGLDDVNKSAKKTIDTFGESAGRTADGIAAMFEASVPKVEPKSPVSSDDATKRLNAYISASKNAEAATKSRSSTDAAARKAQSEQEALQKRIAAGQVEMAKSIAEATEQLNQTGIPAVDNYNAALLRIQESADKFTRDGLPADQVSGFAEKMRDLAKATEEAALAQAQIDAHSQTLDLAAQAADAESAAKGVTGLAVANRDYEKSLEALDKQFESLAISPDDYKSQLDSLDTIHKQAVENLKKQGDESGEFVKQAARGVQDALADALSGEGVKGGFKGFLDGLDGMLRKAAAQIVAAQLAKKLFGDYDKSGQLGGWVGNLFGNSGSTAGATSGASGGDWLSGIAKLFGFGARAMGGPVTPGKGYLVGENGPEFFQPTTSGTVLNNSQTRRMGGGLSLNVSYAVQGRIDRRTQDQLAQSAGREASRALARNG